MRCFLDGSLWFLNADWCHVVLLQGPRMVRDVFRLAKENAPAIIFIDEIDAIATARFDAQTGADREVQRILMELLNQVNELAVLNQPHFHVSMGNLSTATPLVISHAVADLPHSKATVYRS